MILDIRTSKVDPDVNVVELSGRLSLGNALRDAEEKIRKIVAEPGAKTVVDLSGIDFIDSAGIGMLMMCNSSAESSGSRLFISGARDRVKSSFALTHVDRVLNLHADLPSALQAF